jgi:probable blue pigment (indigoidine) exporter
MTRAMARPRRWFGTFPVELVLVVTVVLWSLDYSTQKYSLSHGFAPLAVASTRFLAGGLFFGVLFRATSRENERIPRESRLPLVLASLGAAGAQVCISLSLVRAPASLISLLFGAVPALVFVMSSVISREQTGESAAGRRAVGTAISFAGVALVVVGGPGLSVSALGVVLGIGAAACWALYTVMVGEVVPRLRLLAIAAGVFGMSALPLGLVAAHALSTEAWGSLSLLAWLSFAYGLAFTVVGSNLLWFAAIGQVGAERAALFGNLSPFVGALLAVVLLSETLTGIELLGGAFLAAGIVCGSDYAAPLWKAIRKGSRPSKRCGTQ